MSARTHDIVIIGAGLAGLATAIGLVRHGFTVALVDRQDPRDMTDPGFDGRASAIAYASSKLLAGIGVWEVLDPYAQPILEIRVSDGPSLMHLHFDHAALVAENGTPQGPLGFMIENRHTRIALTDLLQSAEGLDVFAPNGVTSIKRDSGGVTIELQNGDPINASLLLGIDGRNSFVRKHAGLTATQWMYDQVGIVCAIEHEESHAGIAHERFLPSGPFAILPLTGNRSSLVWTEKTRHADAIMALGPRAFRAEVAKRVGDFIGHVDVVGGRWCYPLGLSYASDYIAPRTALLGDAAHAIHPIAGQGLNMGLRDVAALLEILVDARRDGLDIGGADTLERYKEWRRFDNATLIGVTDVLNRLFSNDIAPIRLARDLGLAAVNQIPPLKNFFMSHARGTVGSLPKLLKGERL